MTKLMILVCLFLVSSYWAIGWAANMEFLWWDLVRDQDRGAFAGFSLLTVFVCWIVALIAKYEAKNHD